MVDDNAIGSTWVFEQTVASGQGHWYRVGAGRFAAEGFAVGSVRKVPFRGYTGDIMICPPGIAPPGRRSPASFPILRYAAQIDGEDGEAPGLTWGFRHIHKSGKGHPDDIGIGWLDDEGRARGKFLLRLTSHFKGIVIVCPPGVAPPPGPFPPAVILPTKPGESAPEEDAADEGDGGSEI